MSDIKMAPGEGLEFDKYSDLEVVNRMSVIIPNEKMAISRDEEAALTPGTPAPAYAAASAAASAAATASIATAAAVETTRDQTPRPPSEGGSSVFNPKAVMSQPEEKKILGLRRKMFILVAVGVALVLLTFLGVVLGLTLGKKRAVPPPTTAIESDGTAGVDDFDASKVLDISNIAAVNWTDDSNISRAAVFYQDAANALSVTLFDSLSGGWVTHNITASVMNISSIPSLDVLPGTPLACVTNRYQLNVYYLQSDYRVSEIYSTDPAKGEWHPGAMGTVLDPQATEGSRLAAYWQICPGCSDTFLVAYEADNGIQVANFTSGQWQSMPAITEKLLPGSGISISPFTDFEGNGATGTAANAFRVYHSVGDDLMELIAGPLTDYRWELGNFGNALTSNLPTKPAPEITSLSFGSNGWTNSLATYLTSNGTLVSSHWNGTAWTIEAPEILGTSGNLTAMAATQAQRIYAVVDGGIHQFRIDPEKNPFKWFHVNKLVG